MINFSEISYLIQQHTFITKRLRTDSAVFLVGGCVRNLLLQIEKKPRDIDITLIWDPLYIYKHSNKIWLSHFITEKFGTITFVKKQKKLVNIQYEITPFRTESWYQDFRHPWTINRCSDIILDAKRRDFTINSLYFFADNSFWKQQTKKIWSIDEDKLLSWLKHSWIVWFPDLWLLIIQDHLIITTLFEDGIYRKEQLSSLVKKYNLWKESDYCNFIIDPNKWIQDLFAKKLRAVGDPNHRFQEDALRLLRAIRFVNVINHQLKKEKNALFFDFDKATWNAIKDNHHFIEHIAKERIKDEIIKIFSMWDPFWCIALLDESRLLPYLFPSVYATKFIDQPIRFHPFDVYTHTLLTLYELQKINSNYLVRLAMLYHDVGKVSQFSAYKDSLNKEEIRAILAWPLNHRRWWPELVKKDFSALGFSKKEIDQIARYVANHHKPEEILAWESDDIKKKKLRKFLSEAGYQQIEAILDITIADRYGQYNPLQNNKDFQEIVFLRDKLKEIHHEEWQFTIKDLVINGKTIMKHFKLWPSKLIWELLQQWFDRALNDIKTRNKKRELLDYLRGYLKNKKNIS